MRLSNAPLRDAFLASDLTIKALAAELGVHKSIPSRTLGLIPRQDGSRSRQSRIEESNALRYAKALGVDPIDLGL